MSRLRSHRRRRRQLRAFLPAFQPLEQRELLTLNLTMLNPPPQVEGSNTGPLNLASFSVTTGTLADYTATVSWGDGSTSSAALVPGAGNQATVVDQHIYASAGTPTISVVVAGDGSTGTGSATVQVADTPLAVAVMSFAPVWGQSFSGAVALVTDANPTGAASDLNATIAWGDGNTSVGTVSALGDGQFSISGSDTYSGPGPYLVAVDVQEADGATASASALVRQAYSGAGSTPDQPLSASGVSFTAAPGVAFSGAVATFTESESVSPGNFSAAITWGDGATSAGTIIQNYGGGFTVSGSHAYSAPGAYPVAVSVLQDDGESAAAASAAEVATPPLSATGALVSATAGTPFSGTVANVSDLVAAVPPAELATVINWGDGTTSPGLVAFDATSGLDVIGTHTYSAAGAYAVSVQVSDPAGDTAAATSVANVADAAIALYGAVVSTTEGSSFTATVGTFTDANPAAAASDFTATIAWGDGQTASGTITADQTMLGQFDVTGTYTYAEAGLYAPSVTVISAGGASASATGTAYVADQPLALTPGTVNESAGVLFQAIVATFTDANPLAQATDFDATVQWGDGHSSAATIVADPDTPGQFDVIATHTYTAAGSHAIEVRVYDQGGTSAWVGGTASVADAAIAAQGATIAATAGTAFQGAVATFTSANPFAPAGSFTAMIDWGDGGSSVGTVSADPNIAGQFDIAGTYAYASAGAYTVTVQIASLGGSTTSASGTASVITAPVVVTPSTLDLTAGVAFTSAIATFSDHGPSPLGDLATIDWGDGTTTAGTLAPAAAPGQIAVSGTHTYSAVGSYSVVVSVSDSDGSSGSATTAARVSNLAGAGATLTGTTGSAVSGTVATFTDAGTSFAASDFQTTIDWGDGQTTVGRVTADPNTVGLFDATGTHTYAEAGSDPISVRITDPGGSATTALGLALVADAAITAAGAAVATTLGASFSGTVATFTDANPLAQASDFGAVVDWGDGQVSAGTVAPDPNIAGQFDVTTTHIYAQQGTYAVTVALVGRGGATASSAATASVADAAITAQFESVCAQVGVAFTGTLATFAHGPADTAADFTATINWGDGTTTAGTIAPLLGRAGQFAVSGTHCYAAGGSDPVCVTITGASGASATVSGTAEVSDTAGTGATVLPVAGIPFTGTVASFTNANAGAAASDFMAVIAWGDGSASSGTVTADPGQMGGFDVSGTHTYAAHGLFTTQVHVTDAAGAATIAGTASVAPAPLRVTAADFSAAAGGAFQGTVARFTDGGANPLGNDSATIAWGDGATTAATVTASATAGVYDVTGLHTYTTLGAYDVVATVSDSDGSADAALATASVSNLTSTGVTLSATAGSPYSGPVATFTSASAGAQAGDFTAAITWGDGGTSAGTITTDPNVAGQFDVAGAHTYPGAGTDAVSVRIVAPDGTASTAATTADVADAAIAALGLTFAGTEGASFSGTVATFTDANPDIGAGAFTATIAWGDGTTSAGQVTANATIAGQFDVTGTHAYAAPGTESVSVQVSDTGGATASATTTVQVAYAPITATFDPFSVAPAAAANVIVATFSQGPSEVASSFSAAIDWGDGTTTSGAITAVAGAPGQFAVSGTHTYAAAGADTVTVTIAGPSSQTAAVSGQAGATDLTGAGGTINAVEASRFSGTVATFQTTASGPTAADFSAVINWGDDSSSPGTVSADPAGGFDVTGAHVFGAAGSYTTHVAIAGPNGESATLPGTATVAPPVLVVAASGFFAKAGRSFSGTVATFVAGNSDPATNFTAAIDWGDGTTSPGTIVAPTAAADYFAVTGTHAYASIGSDTVAVTVSDLAGGTAVGSATAHVSDMSLGLQSIRATEASAFSGLVATFSDNNLALSETDFTAAIDWGDGTTTAGTIGGHGYGSYQINGATTYAAPGTYPVTITLVGPGGETVEAAGAAAVAPAGISGSGLSISASEGTPFSGEVATFTDGNPAATPASFTALVTWGDGTVSAGTITAYAGGGGWFDVNGTHTYAAPGSDALRIQVTAAGGASVTMGASATVAHAPIIVQALAIQAAAGLDFDGLVASFTKDSGEPASDFTATIAWGDGTTSSGTITAPAVAGGAFSVAGDHNYAATGPETLSVTISDLSGATGAASATATVGTFGASGELAQGRAGLTGTFTVAAFSDANTADVPSDFSATIDWGDGATSAGTVRPDPATAGQYTVTGTTNYPQQGDFSVTVQIDNGTATAATPVSVAAITSAPLTASGATVAATEGLPVSGTVATFSDANPNDTAGDFTATIDWGDGTTTVGAIADDPSTPGQFDVLGTHTYAHTGSDAVAAQITENGGGATAQASSTASVADAPLTAVAVLIQATAGASFTGTVATFSDANPAGAASDFTASINWGDGTVTSATIVADPAGGFDVSALHSYDGYGSYTVQVQVADTAGSNASATSTAVVADAALSASAAPTVLNTTAGQLFAGDVVSFTDANPNAPASDFTASIDWGDGTTTAGTVSATGPGLFTVTAAHTFAQAGADGVAVTVSDKAGQTLALTNTANVTDAAIDASGAPLDPVSTAGFQGVVANFTDANPNLAASDFSASINWGDGTWSSGTIAANPAVYGQFQVSGTHTYRVAGDYPIAVTISDSGGESASASTTALVTGGGSWFAQAMSAAAGAFNTAFSGPDDTDTTSFDLGFLQVTPANVDPGAAAPQGGSSPTANSGMISVAAGAAAPASGSFVQTFAIAPQGGDGGSGSGSAGDEIVTVSETQTANGTSTSGTYWQSFTITISTPSYENDSSVGVTNTDSITDTTTITETAAGTYSVHNGQTTISGSYSSAETDTTTTAITDTGSGAGATSSLSETSSITSSDADSGSYTIGPSGYTIVETWTISMSGSDTYSSVSSFTGAWNGGSTTQTTTAMGMDSWAYTEHGFLAATPLSLTETDSYTDTQSGTGSGTVSMSFSSATDAGSANATSSYHTNFAALGSVAIHNTNASSSNTFTDTQGGVSSGSMSAMGSLASVGLNGTYSVSQGQSGTENLTVMGTTVNTNGAFFENASMNDSANQSSTSSYADSGSSAGGGASSSFSDASANNDTNSVSSTGTLVILAGVQIVSGNTTTSDEGGDSDSSTSSGSTSGNGSSGTFSSASTDNDVYSNGDSSSISSTGTSFTATDNSSTLIIDAGTFADSDSGNSSSFTNTGGNTSYSIDFFGDSDQGQTTVTTSGQGSDSASNSGTSSIEMAMQSSSGSSSSASSDAGNVVDTSSTGWDTTAYQTNSHDSGTFSSNLMAVSSTGSSGGANVSGIYASTSSDNGAGTYSETDQFGSNSSGNGASASSSGTATDQQYGTWLSSSLSQGSFTNGDVFGSYLSTSFSSTSNVAADNGTSMEADANSGSVDSYTDNENDSAVTGSQDSGSLSPNGATGTTTTGTTTYGIEQSNDMGVTSDSGTDPAGGHYGDVMVYTSSSTENSQGSSQTVSNYSPSSTTGTYVSSQYVIATQTSWDSGSSLWSDPTDFSTDNYTDRSSDTTTATSNDKGSSSASGNSGTSSVSETDNATSASKDTGTYSSALPGQSITENDASTSSSSSLTTGSSTNNYSPGSSMVQFTQIQITSSNASDRGSETTTGTGNYSDFYYWSTTSAINGGSTTTGYNANGANTSSVTNVATEADTDYDGESTSSGTAGNSNNSSWSEFDNSTTNSSNSGTTITNAAGSITFESGMISNSLSDHYTYNDSGSGSSSYSDSASVSTSGGNWSDNETFDDNESTKVTASGTPGSITSSLSYSVRSTGSSNSTQVQSQSNSFSFSSGSSSSLTIASDYGSASDNSTYSYSDSGSQATGAADYDHFTETFSGTEVTLTRASTSTSYTMSASSNGNGPQYESYSASFASSATGTVTNADTASGGTGGVTETTTVVGSISSGFTSTDGVHTTIGTLNSSSSSLTVYSPNGTVSGTGFDSFTPTSVIDGVAQDDPPVSWNFTIWQSNTAAPDAGDGGPGNAGNARVPLSEQWGLGTNPTAVFLLGVGQLAVNAGNGFVNMLPGVDIGDVSQNLLVYEDPGAHQFQMNVGGRVLMMAATKIPGVGTAIALAGCAMGGGGLGLLFKGAGLAYAAWNTVGDVQKFIGAVSESNFWGALEHGSNAVLDVLDIAGAFLGTCFAAGTPIRTPDGSKPIEQLKVGDWVLAAPEHDPEAPPQPRRVLQVFENYAPLLNLRIGGRIIRTTAEHPFWVEGRGWTHAHQLMAGDRLRSNDGRAVVLEAVEGEKEAAPVYNVEVEEYHTYFVGCAVWGFTVWSHNAGRVCGGASTKKLNFGQQVHQNFEDALIALTGTRRGDWLMRTKPGLTGVDATYIGPKSRYPGFDHAELKPATTSGFETFLEQLSNWDLLGKVQLWLYSPGGSIGSTGGNWW